MISGVVFGLMPSAVTFCYSQGVTASLVVLFRYAILSLTFIPAALKADKHWRGYKYHWKKLLALTSVGTATPMLLFSSYKYLPTGISTTIHFMYPIVVVLICMVVFHERLSKVKALCVALCTVGIFLMLEAPAQKISLVGLLIAFLSSITWGCYIVILNKTDFSPLDSGQVIFFVGIGSFFMITVYGVFTRGFSTSVTGIGWLVLLLSDFVIAVFGSAFFAIGTQYTDAQSSAVASTLEPITSVIVGASLLNEQLSIHAVFGIAAILAAIMILAISKSKETIAAKEKE